MNRVKRAILAMGVLTSLATSDARAQDAFDRLYSGQRAVEVSVAPPEWRAARDRESQRVNTYIVGGGILGAGIAIGAGLFFALRKPCQLRHPVPGSQIDHPAGH